MRFTALGPSKLPLVKIPKFSVPDSLSLSGSRPILLESARIGPTWDIIIIVQPRDTSGHWARKNQNFKEQSPRAISRRIAILPALAALASLPAYILIIYNLPCLFIVHRCNLFVGPNLHLQSILKSLSGHLVFVTHF